MRVICEFFVLKKSLYEFGSRNISSEEAEEPEKERKRERKSVKLMQLIHFDYKISTILKDPTGYAPECIFIYFSLRVKYYDFILQIINNFSTTQKVYTPTKFLEKCVRIEPIVE